MRAPSDFLTKLPNRIVDEIRRHIIKRDKRDAISRCYHAKDDEEAIATWKLDLDKILCVFNVRSVVPVRRLLISRFQTGLRMNEHATDSATHPGVGDKHTIHSSVHHDTSDAKAIIPNVRRGVLNTNSAISGIHYNKPKCREGADGRNQVLSIACALPVTDQLFLLPGLTPGQRSQYSESHCLVFAFGAPGGSPPPLQRSVRGVDSDTRHDAASEVQTIAPDIRHMSKSQERADYQLRLAS